MIKADSTEVTLPIGVFSINHSEDIEVGELEICFPYEEVDEGDFEFSTGYVSNGDQRIDVGFFPPEWIVPILEDAIYTYQRNTQEELNAPEGLDYWVWK